MDNFEDFEDLFDFNPLLAYGEQTINHILKCRRLMENELFIDRLLKTLGIAQAIDLYPPRSNQDLRDLHLQIIESTSPDHHKQSILYYILRDITGKDAQPASTFAKAVFLPERYRIFMDGIWFLDHANFAKALDYLTEPVLIPTFPEELLYTLCIHPEQRDEKLSLAYYYTVSPAITSPKVLNVFFPFLVRAGVTEAFFWARKQGESRHRMLFEQLISIVLGGKEGEERARRSVEMIHLPFNEKEEVWFEAYLSEGKGGDLPGAEDTLSVRKMVTGQASAIADSATGFGFKNNDGMDWSSLGSSFEHGSMTAR
ncbi:MAG: hypothetical protein LQ338_001824 [Usnochroma carphineum]|nr:MAG: hypothetical protein LQ338_001824 [Usnochroma carphineum]